MPKVTCARIMASLIVGALLTGFGISFIISQAQTTGAISIPLIIVGGGLTLLGVVFLLKPCIDTHCQRDIDDHGPNCKCAQSKRHRKRKGNSALAGSEGCRSTSSTCAGAAGPKGSKLKSKGSDSKTRTVNSNSRSESPSPNEQNVINTKLDMVAIGSKFGLRTRLETLPEEDSNLDLSESTTPQEETAKEEIAPDQFMPTMV